MAGSKPDEQAHLSNGYDHRSSGYNPVQQEEEGHTNPETMAGSKPDEQAHLSNGYDHRSSGYNPVQQEEEGHTSIEMTNLEVQQLSPNGNARGQEERPELRSLSAKYRKAKTACCIQAIILAVCIIIIFILVPFLVKNQKIQAVQTGRSVPSNHQKDDCCPPDWIGHQGHCYKLSREEKNWSESQNFCMLHNASLAKITDEETEFVTMLTRNQVFWIGLLREPDQLWKWLDGTNATLEVLGNGGDCAILNDDAKASAWRCSAEHRYICKKNDPKGS